MIKRNPPKKKRKGKGKESEIKENSLTISLTLSNGLRDSLAPRKHFSHSGAHLSGPHLTDLYKQDCLSSSLTRRLHVATSSFFSLLLIYLFQDFFLVHTLLHCFFFI